MVGGTRVHRWIYEASLGADEKSFLFRKAKNEPPRLANSKCLLTEPTRS
jgi:hypothetical protein